ncbi:MAG: M1 family aminopeptidase [Nitrososphaerales archaeon]
MPRSFVLPGQPTRYARETPFQIGHLKLEIEPDFESMMILAKTTYRIRPVGKQISSVVLDASDLSFKSILVNGTKAKYETKPHSVKVELGFDLQVGSTVDVYTEYTAVPKQGLYFRGPSIDFPDRFVHLFTQGQAEDSKYWYPCFDYPNMRFTSEVIAKAPANMVVVSNGKLVSTKVTEDGKKIWHFSQEIPHSSYLLSLIVGNYETITEDHDGISVEYYVPRDRKADAPRSFQKTPLMLDFFGRVTGLKYPYPKYAQTVVSDFMFGGMENISATTLTEKTLHDERAHLDFQSENLVSHELAHQWFGDYLTCKDWSHAWLNEGFATYFNALFREFDEGSEDFQYAMHSNFEKLDDDINERYDRQIVEKRYWDPEELFDSHTYEKGAWVLNGIRGLLGDDLFWKAIRKYVAKCKVSIVETSDFRKILEDVSGIDFEEFFKQWLYSPGYPDYMADYSYEHKSGLARLDLEQVNAEVDGVPLFTTPLDLEFTFQDGTKRLDRISLTQRKNSFFFSLVSKPANVSLDPKNWCLKKLKFHKPKELLLHQLKFDENSMERIRAASELADFKTKDVVDALSRSVDSDKFWGVQLEAAKNLGKIGTREALDALRVRKDFKDHRVRRGVAAGLRYFAKLEENDAAINTLINYLYTDVSYYVRAYSVHSLGFYPDSEKVFIAMRESLNQGSVNDQIRYRAFLGFAELKNPKALPLAIEYLQNGKEYQGRNGAAHAIGKIGRGDPAALKALLSARSMADIRVRAECAGAVANLEDATAIPQLEGWLSNETSGRVRRRLRETINRLRESANQSSQEALQKEIRALEERTKKLDEALSTLEAKTR